MKQRQTSGINKEDNTGNNTGNNKEEQHREHKGNNTVELTELIKHPERMDRDTLYELRSLLALYPYFQTARLLMLQNLFLFHDPSFDEELRRAAIYITDRRTIFDMIEAAHYKLPTPTATAKGNSNTTEKENGQTNRTVALIDSFLESIPKTTDETKDGDTKTAKTHRKPTPADAAVDYVAYLIDSQMEDEQSEEERPQMKGQALIDSFINNDKGKIVLSDKPQYTPQTDEQDGEAQNGGEEGYFTETLARIYIKQGRYSKAYEIIKQISLQYPKKNAYFADQLRFLEKLIINNKQK